MCQFYPIQRCLLQAHVLTRMNIWPPVHGADLGGCEIFRRWNFTGDTVLLVEGGDGTLGFIVQLHLLSFICF